MTESNSTAAPSHDAIRLLSDLLALVANPTAAKKVVSDLLDASSRHQAIVDAAKGEMAKLSDLHADVENGVATLRTSTAKRLADDAAAFDRRIAERETAVSAREARAAVLEQKAVEHEAAASKDRAFLAEKRRLLSA